MKEPLRQRKSWPGASGSPPRYHCWRALLRKGLGSDDHPIARKEAGACHDREILRHPAARFRPPASRPILRCPISLRRSKETNQSRSRSDIARPSPRRGRREAKHEFAHYPARRRKGYDDFQLYALEQLEVLISSASLKQAATFREQGAASPLFFEPLYRRAKAAG
jgi:hypothetical protein